jgi:hypothetical protein
MASYIVHLVGGQSVKAYADDYKHDNLVKRPWWAEETK